MRRLVRPSREEQLSQLRSQTPAGSFQRRLLDVLGEGGYRLPDAAGKLIEAPACAVDFFYAPNVCVFCEGPAQDQQMEAARDRELHMALVQRGYRVLVIRCDQDIRSQLAQYPEVFGLPEGR